MKKAQAIVGNRVLGQTWQWLILILATLSASVTAEETLRFSLESYMQAVLEKNQDLELRAYKVKQSEALAASKHKISPFSAGVSVDNGGASRLSTDVQDSVDVVETKTNTIAANLSKTLLTGSEIGLAYGYSFADGNSKRLPPALRSYHSSYMNATLKQPVLAGVSNIYYKRKYRLSETESRASTLEYQQLVSQTVMEAVSAYYQLLQAQQKLNLKQSSITSAKASLKRLEQLVEKKLESEEKLLQAISNVLEKENDVFAAESEKQEKRQVFFNLINQMEMGQGLELSSEPTVPYAVRSSLNLDSLWQIALQSRPDFLKTESALEATRINLAMKKSSTLPKLDIKSNYYIYGTDSEFDETFGKMGSQDFKSWSIGLNLNLVVDKNHRRNQILPLEISLKEKRHQKATQERRIKRELKSAINRLELNFRQYMASRQSLEIARTKMKGATELLDKKFINLEKHYEYQKNFETAQFNHLKSCIEFTINFYALQEKTGSLPAALNLAIAR